MSQANGSRWLRWLHRVGYITTTLVLAQILIVSFVLARDSLRNYRIDQAVAERTRTHGSPVDPVRDVDVVQRLARMTPLGRLYGDGLRFVALPSFGTTEYGVVISLAGADARQADGVLTTFRKDGQRNVEHRPFVIPVTEYRTLTSQIDKLTDGWRGDASLCTDGVGIGFERVRATRITSGVGRCSEHYRKIATLVLAVLRRYAPGRDLPTEDDWHRFDPKDKQ